MSVLNTTRCLAGLALAGEGLVHLGTPGVFGIPLVLGGFALLACNLTAVDGLVVRLENWRHLRLQPYRIRR